MKTADLHTHSTSSDGLLAPADVVAFMAARGFSAMALTDHDSVAGIDEALTAGAAHGIEVIAGVELSVAFRHYSDVHLLGYFIDHRDPGLLALLDDFRTARSERGKAIIDRVNLKLQQEKRAPVSYEEVLSLSAGAVGRPHIARTLIARGYAATMDDAFRKYLEPCDVPKRYIAIADGIAEIRRSGGVPVLAHPLSVTRDRRILRELVGELKVMGLEGLEAFCPMAMGPEGNAIQRIARDAGLVATGGSDFHGNETAGFKGVGAEVIGELRARRPAGRI